jgi:ferritin
MNAELAPFGRRATRRRALPRAGNAPRANRRLPGSRFGAYVGQHHERSRTVINDKLQQAINSQINAELHSAYIYLSMSAYFGSLGLDGSAHWMRLQAQEELMHGMKFYDYMVVSGGRILLTPVEGPATSWDSPLAAFEAALAHERLMTRRCNDLASLAIAEKDHATNNLVQWFVTEQVEEEANVENIVQKMKLLGRDGPGLFMMDRELKSRVVAPAATGGGAAA